MKIRLDVLAETKEEIIDEIFDYSKTVAVIDFIDESENDGASEVVIEGSEKEIKNLLMSDFYGCDEEDAEYYISLNPDL